VHYHFIQYFVCCHNARAKHHMVDLAKVTGTRTYDRITPIGIEAAAGIQPKSLLAPGGVNGYYSLVEDKYEILCGSRF
jgi:hypothetical protein